MLMTKAAYARHKGVSRQTVYDWIAKGELVLVGGKIDFSASEQKATGFVTPTAWCDDSKRVNISPKAALFSQTNDYSEGRYQLIPASPGEAAAIVLALDDVYPSATTCEEIQTGILDAVEALGRKPSTRKPMPTSTRRTISGLSFQWRSGENAGHTSLPPGHHRL